MEGVAPYTAQLASHEQVALACYEQVIARGLRTFYDVGNALAQIRDDRLYRATHATFEDYCRERWGMSRSRAHRLIDAATVYETVLPIGNILPANEAQARPLVRLEPEQRVAVWQEAEATAVNGKPTAAHIEHVAQTLYPPATAAPVPPPPTSVHFLSDSEEWYTPLYVIERAIEFFGEIDLDPCAPDKLVPVVPARTIYTKADDGLVQPWSGRVWMNPPYGESIGFWIQKLITAYRDGSIEAGLALLPSRTEAAWFSPLWDFPLCFVRGRLKFRNPAGKENGAPFGSVIACISGDVDEFARWFGDLGHIVNAH